MKRLMGLCLTFILIINIAPVMVNAGNYPEKLYIRYNDSIYKYTGRLVTVEINNNVVKPGDMPAIIIDKRTMVPAREVFESEAFGATVDWNGERQQVSIAYDDKLIVLEINSKVAYVNGVAVELDVPPMLIQDVSKEFPKTMIPLRFVSESLSFDVDWDQSTYTAMLNNGKGDQSVATKEPDKVDSTTTKEEGQQADDGADTDKTSEVSTGEKLESLGDAGANKPLPTPLSNNPIRWSATSEQLTELDGTNVDTTITDEEHSEVQIDKVTYDGEGIYKKFVIEASSAMSAVDYFVWDNKFIIDISNSVNTLEAEKTYEDNPILTSIRASQYSTAPNATRIVFDLIEGGNKFDLSFNEDRDKLVVRVTDNSIHDILLGQNDKGDFIQVTGVAAPDVKMFRLSAPDRIVIDFPNTQSLLGFNESLAEGQYVEKIRTAQFDSTTTRIVVETDGQADYEITQADNGQTVIQFKEPNYRNIEYENVNNPTIALDQNEGAINVEGIVYNNDYMNRTFTITLSQNYGSLFGDGSLKVNDGIIETIDVKETEAGLTKIVIKSTTVYEYRIEEADNKIYIKAYKPKELYSKIVVVDAGHGGKDPGALGNGLNEKTLNLTITKYLKELLDENSDIRVYYTRLEDVYPTLQERCDLANEVEADLFLSVHNNAYNASHTGTETLFFPSEEVVKLTSPALAKIFQDTLVANLGSNDRGTKQREKLFVLHHTSMPAVITEIGFLTNTEDAAKLKESSYLEKTAAALYKGILKVFDAYPTRR